MAGPIIDATGLCDDAPTHPLAAKGLRVEVEEGRCEVDGDASCGFRIRVKGPLESGAAG